MVGEGESENAVLLEAANKFGEFETVEFGDGDLPEDIGSTPVILSVPTGRRLISLKAMIDEHRVRPERKAGTSELTTIDSFVAQVNRSKDANTVLFADVASRTEPKLLAVFDYNEAGSDGLPRFGKHRALYRFPVSEQWKAWTVGSLEGLDQVTFAAFLENRIMDVLDPTSTGKTLDAFCKQLGITLASPQRLMELSRGLTVHADHKVTQVVNIGTGEAQIGFIEDHKDTAGAPLKVPGGFAIAIPVYRNGPAYQIPVRLRYKVAGGQVRWTLQPQRLDEVWDLSIEEAVNAVSTKTECTTLFGKPEA